MGEDPELSDLVSLVEELDSEEEPFQLPVTLMVGGERVIGNLVSHRAWLDHIAGWMRTRSEMLDGETIDPVPEPKNAQQGALEKRLSKSAARSRRAAGSVTFLHMSGATASDATSDGTTIWRLALARVDGWSLSR